MDTSQQKDVTRLYEIESLVRLQIGVHALLWRLGNKKEKERDAHGNAECYL